MKKQLIAFSVLLLVPIGLDNAFAATIEIKDQATCQALGGNFFVTSAADGCFFGSLTVDADDTLILENLFIATGPGGFTNFGNVMLIGGDETNSGAINLGQDGDLVNECGATITIEGGDGLNSGGIQTDLPGEDVTNFGTINLNGGVGQASATIVIFSILNNHGLINENPGSGSFSGIIRLGSTGVFNDKLPSQCQVGGEFLPIETTTLLLANAQSFSWMIPVVLSGIGIGLFVVSRKPENS